MTDPTTLLSERVDKLLAELDPGSTSQEEFRGRQYDLGLAWVHFPEGYGGLGLAPIFQRDIDERIYAAGARPPGVRHFFGLTMAGPTIVTNGDDAVRERLLRPTFTGEEAWCQLFSEPGAGSDLAGLATKAVRDGDEWVINGQKVWNTFAHLATRGMLVARTDPEAPKHRGLTYFALDMTRPGRRGAAAAPDHRRGRVQRGVHLRRPGARRRPHRRRGRGLAGVDDHPHERADHHRRRRQRPAPGFRRDRRGRPHLDRGGRRPPSGRARPAHAAVDRGGVPAPDQHPRASQNRRVGNPGPEGSIAKLKFAEVNMAIYELCVDLLGAAATVDYDYAMRRAQPLGLTGPPGSSRKMFLRARANSIEGGTSEIQRNILGERVLGLPGEPRVDKDLPWSQVPR